MRTLGDRALIATYEGCCPGGVLLEEGGSGGVGSGLTGESSGSSLYVSREFKFSFGAGTAACWFPGTVAATSSLDGVEEGGSGGVSIGLTGESSGSSLYVSREFKF